MPQTKVNQRVALGSLEMLCFSCTPFPPNELLLLNWFCSGYFGAIQRTSLCFHQI